MLSNSSKSTKWVAVLFLVLQFDALSVSALIGCAAEANFQACKSIETSLLQGCGPVDYSCQCNAQKLIQQCYNLCPEYSIEANEQARITTGICAAVPTTSIAPIPSGSSLPSQVAPTFVAPTTSASTTAPSSSQSVQSAASALNLTPTTGFMTLVAAILGLAIAQL